MSSDALWTLGVLLHEFLWPCVRHICDFSMNCKLEQRANIKYCNQFGKTGTEIFRMIWWAYGNESCEVFWVTLALQEWHNITGRWREIRTTQHKYNPLKILTTLGKLCIRIQRTIQDIADISTCHTEQHRQSSHLMCTSTILQTSLCPEYWFMSRRGKCWSLSGSSSTSLG